MGERRGRSAAGGVFDDNPVEGAVGSVRGGRLASFDGGGVDVHLAAGQRGVAEERHDGAGRGAVFG